MKIKIYEEGKTEKDNLYIKLIEINGDIVVTAVDHNGNYIKRGNIISFDNEYKCIVLMEHINDLIPLKTDVVNCPLIYKVPEMEEIIDRNKINDMKYDMAESIKKMFSK